MKCNVQDMSKNLRYRILTIDGEEYILDMGRSFLKNLFPFLFWMLPNTVFKMDDPNIVGKLKSPEVSQTKTGNSSVLGGGIGVLLASLLKPIADYFAIPNTPLINTLILAMVVIFAFVYLHLYTESLKRSLIML